MLSESAGTESRDVELSVVIPVYRSAACLRELVRQLDDELGKLQRPFEVILVDDGSPDDSWRVIEELSARYPPVRGVSLMRNAGQAKATLCGLANASGNTVITMDDDLQHRPNQIPKLLEALEEQPKLDCVFGYFPEKHHAAYRNLGSRLIWWINRRAEGLPPDAKPSSFCVMRRSLADAVVSHQTRNPAIVFLIYASTHRVGYVPIEHAPRYAGQSNYTLARQLRMAFDVICNVTMLPLRLVFMLGVGMCLLSMCFVVFYVARYLLGKIGVPGWTTVVVLISLFSGTILIAIGVLGEYLARVFWEVRRPPLYIERERAGFDRDAGKSE